MLKIYFLLPTATFKEAAKVRVSELLGYEIELRKMTSQFELLTRKVL